MKKTFIKAIIEVDVEVGLCVPVDGSILIHIDLFITTVGYSPVQWYDGKRIFGANSPCFRITNGFITTWERDSQHLGVFVRYFTYFVFPFFTKVQLTISSSANCCNADTSRPMGFERNEACVF